MMNVLGIETSCDETSAAMVAGGRKILSNIVASQADLHARWGGVVPEVASRKHVEQVLPVVEEALFAAGVTYADIEGIAVTNRPGLVGALLVGVSAAKALSFLLRKPIVGVHHLEGHLFSGFLADPHLEYPFVALIVSGGHTALYAAHSDKRRELLGSTRDDAAGECFDKCARLLGLPYPGGPNLEKLAVGGDPKLVSFPRAWLGDSLGFSFSGLKTAVRRFMETDQGKTGLDSVAASLQAAIVDVLVGKAVRAAETKSLTSIVVAGGVSANLRLRDAMNDKCFAKGIKLVVPPSVLCTDNAAMIAAAGATRLMRGESDDISFDTFAASELET